MVTLDARTGKWVLLALVVSLGLNLFVGGLVVGGRFHHPPPGAFLHERHVDAKNEPRVFLFVNRMARELPPDERRNFMTVVNGYRGELTEADRNLRDARKRVREAMAAEPFDRAALENAFADVRVRFDDLQKVLHGALADAASRLPPDARQRLAQQDSKDRRR